MELNITKCKNFNIYSNICRTCCIYSNELFLINDVHWDGIDLKEIFINWTNLQLNDDDELPKNICKSCIKSIYQMYRFLFKCKKVRNILNQFISKSLDGTCAKLKLEDNVPEKVDVKDEENENPYRTKATEQENEIKDAIHEEKVQLIERKCDRIKLEISAYENETLSGFIKDTSKSKRPYTCRKGPPFKCITCDAIFTKYDDLKKHKSETKHRKSFKYSCPHCQKRLDVYSKYQEHVRTHTGEKPNKCPTCGKGFNFKTDMRRHSYIHLDIKPYKCQLCNEGFSRKQYLRDHERKQHTGEKLICLFCGKEFCTYSSLVYHEKIHKGYERDPLILTGIYQCDLCDKELASEHSLKSHMLLHGPKNYVCEICSNTYATNDRLRSHILTHQDPKFQCNICNKAYKQKHCLEEHLKSHSGQNNYDCHLCGKQFACKSSLRQHKRIHTGDTKYQCKECLKICINKRNLENHTRIHTGEKPYNCEYCGKLFKQKIHLTEHRKIHTGEKNHMCNMCDKRFYNARSLRNHISNIHEKK